MEAATVETQAEVELTRFISPYPNLRVVVTPGRDQEKDVYDRIIRPRVASLAAEFERGIFETRNPKLIEGLVSNPNYQRDYWIQGVAPNEPKPTLSEQVTRISAAAAVGDRTEIEAALAEERDTHNREAVILAAEASLRALEPGV